MYELLTTCFKNISVSTRRLLERSKASVDGAFAQAASQLGTFLAPELSEAHLGLSSGMRIHLDRFRAFLIAFYSERLGGQYPPNVWTITAYRTLQTDFDALYHLLVDERFTSSESTPFVAQGGICAIQSVHSFDVRQNLSSLRHPLPLLPEIAPNMLPTPGLPLWPVMAPSTTVTGGTSSSTGLHGRKPPPSSPPPSSVPRRMFSRSVSASIGLGHGSGASVLADRPDKLRPDERLVTQAALIKATNHQRADLLKNALVRAYRRFEEDETYQMISAASGPTTGTRMASRFPAKNSGGERTSLVDARKVRWILVYATHQILRSMAEPAAEVRNAEQATYLMPASIAAGLPVWDELCDARGRFETAGPAENVAASVSQIEIKPDIDYMGMYQQQEEQQQLQQQLQQQQQQQQAQLAQQKSTKRRTLLLPTQLPDSGPPSRQPSPSRAAPATATPLLPTRGSLRRSLSALYSSNPTTTRLSKPRPKEAFPPTTEHAADLVVIKRAGAKHNEIVVHGYGNGLTSAFVNAPLANDPYRLTPNDIKVVSTDPSLAQRTRSTSSNTSNNSKISATSRASSCITVPTTAPPTPIDELPHMLPMLVEPEDLPHAVLSGPGLGLGGTAWPRGRRLSTIEASSATNSSERKERVLKTSRSWRDDRRKRDDEWTIVSPSLGEGNTTPLEMTARGGFVGRMSGMGWYEFADG